MSGPLSSNEIEDVVSSVRRLVSTDARPPVMSRDLRQDRLMLTPALQVVPNQWGTAPLLLTTPLDETPDNGMLLAVNKVLTPNSAEMPPGPVEAQWQDEIWPAPEARLAEIALLAEEADVVAIARQEAAPLSADRAAPDVGASWEEDEPMTVVPLPVKSRAANSKTAPSTKTTVEPTSIAKTAPKVKTKPGPKVATKTAPKPKTAAPKAPLKSVTKLVDHSKAETKPLPVKPDPFDNVVQLAAAAPTLVDADGNPLTVLDEEALEAFVREMIREELRGVLGERITRNVRKLVRAEINRALTARGLD